MRANKIYHTLSLTAQCSFKYSFSSSYSWLTNAISFLVKFYGLTKGISIVHSSGSPFIQFKLNEGNRPARGCFILGTNYLSGSQVFWAGISSFSTIQLNKAIPRNCMDRTATILNPKCENLQYIIKKNMKRVFMIGKNLKNGLVLMKISAANYIIAKYPNKTYPTPPSMG